MSQLRTASSNTITTEQLLDKGAQIAFEYYSKNKPEVVQSIKRMVDRGESPHDIMSLCRIAGMAKNKVRHYGLIAYHLIRSR